MWEPRNAQATGETDFAATLHGLEWDAQDRDETWFVSYADIISTFLAMVVLLFGRVSLSSTAATEAVAEPQLVAEMLPPAAPSAVATVALPEPVAPPEPTLEDRFVTLVDARFAGRIGAERRNEGLVLTIPEVALFDSARAELQQSAHALLAELSATLHEVGDAQVAVEGHTDDRPVTGGAFDSNWDLAAARANAVTRYLLDAGFDALRLHSVSYADTRPVADNGTPAGRAANRRVELKVEFVGS